MKKMIKSALALVAAVVVGSSAWAADNDESCDVTMTVGVTSNMLAKLNVADAATANWVLHSSDKTIATVAWDKDGDNKNVVAITSVANGQAEVVARSPEDVEYTFNVYVSTVEMEKSIKAASEDDPDDKSNATIRVVTHVDCGKTDRTPRVLFIGSLCGKHSLKQETVEKAMDAIVKKATVDWFFFDNGKSEYNNVTCKNGYHGTFEQSDDGSTVKNLPSVGNTSDTKHCNLKAYLSTITNCLDIASDDWQQYDFIVLEFDSDRLLEYYDYDEALEKRAARCLKKFYEKHLVLWLLDNEPSDNPWGKGDESTPWWTPTTYTKNGAAAVDGKWNGYVALFDPETYFDKTNGERYVSFETKSGTTYYKANRISEQVTYNNSTQVVKTINDYMKFPSFAAEAADKVVTAGGTMSIPGGAAGVTLWNWEGSGDPQAKGDNYMADDTGWVKETDAKKQPKVNGDQVTCVVSNLNGSTWQKLEIKVRTTPEFMAEAIADAKGDQKFCTPNGDGTFSVNPNNGEATMELSRSLDGKKQGTLATGAAAAANAWIVELPEFEFTVSAVNRPYDGTSTNVTVNVTDKESHEELETSLYKLAYSTDGGTTWTTNTVADFYAAFKDVVDTTVAVKVVITGDDTYKPSDDSQSATLTITPLTVTVTAGNGSKTYDGAAADLSKTTWSFSGTFADGEQGDIEALISAGITNTQGEVKAFVLKDGSVNAGTYDITTNKILAANQNYNVNFTPGTFVINPAQIKGFHFDDTTYDSAAKPAVLAKNVDCFVEDISGSVNIKVDASTSKPFGTDKFSYELDNKTGYSTLGVYTNFCTVSGGGNYLSTNVYAEVIVRQRKPDIEGGVKPSNAADIEKTLLKIAKDIANKKAVKPIYAEARLTANSADGTDDALANEETFLGTAPARATDIESASYDITLDYTEDLTSPVWTDIGNSNETKIKIVIKCDIVKNADRVEVWRKHGTKISKANWSDGTATVDKSKGTVTINVSKFSTYEVFAYTIPPPPKSDCVYIPVNHVVEETAWAYQWKFTGKTTKGVKATCNEHGWVTRSSASLKIQGWSFYCEPHCGDFEAMGADELFWQVKPAKVFFDDKSGVSFEVANVIGKKGRDYETSGQANFTADGVAYQLAFAGLGKYDSKNARVSSIKGNFAGWAKAPSYTNGKPGDCDYDSNLSKVWECCGCPTLDADSVAYGKWTVKFHKTNAKKYANSTLNERKLIPSWAR